MWSWTPAFLAACLALGGAEPMRAAGLGAQMTSIFHVLGLAASFSMGAISDRLGRRAVPAVHGRNEHGLLLSVRVDHRPSSGRGHVPGGPVRLLLPGRFPGVLGHPHGVGQALIPGRGPGAPISPGIRGRGCSAPGVRSSSRLGPIPRRRPLTGFGAGPSRFSDWEDWLRSGPSADWKKTGRPNRTHEPAGRLRANGCRA